jgi:hypothetical protein
LYPDLQTSQEFSIQEGIVSISEVEPTRANERVSNGRPYPIRVAVYGSSLFLTAVAAALRNHTAVHLIHFPHAVTTAAILRQLPTILIWQNHFPPEDMAALLRAGIGLLNVDEQQSCITLQRHGRPQQTLPIRQSTDLIAWIMQTSRQGVFQ